MPEKQKEIVWVIRKRNNLKAALHYGWQSKKEAEDLAIKNNRIREEEKKKFQERMLKKEQERAKDQIETREMRWRRRWGMIPLHPMKKLVVEELKVAEPTETVAEPTKVVETSEEE